MSNYATKSDLKNTTVVDTLQFAKKDDLANLKLEVDKLNIGKLETTHSDLGKLSNVVKMKLLKRPNMMNWLKRLMLLVLVNLLTNQIIMLK